MRRVIASTVVFSSPAVVAAAGAHDIGARSSNFPAVLSPVRCATSSSSSSSSAPPRGIQIPRDEGISRGLEGFSHYGGSINAFTRSDAEKKASSKDGSQQDAFGANSGARPCDTPGSEAAMQAAAAQYMADIATSGVFPSPRRPSPGSDKAAPKTAQSSPFFSPSTPSPHNLHPHPPQQSSSSAAAAAAATTHIHTSTGTGKTQPSSPQQSASKLPQSPFSSPSSSSASTAQSSPSSLPKRNLSNRQIQPRSSASSSLPRNASKAPETEKKQVKVEAAAKPPASDKKDPAVQAREAEDYYSSVPRSPLTKEEMWTRINMAKADKAESMATAMDTSSVDYYHMEEELRTEDMFHYQLGELGYPDQMMRRDYYALWQLSIALNKARWTMLDVHNQRGVKTTGAGVKLLFWKEAVNEILERRQMPSGQFTDSHPVIRPFAATVKRNPHLTKAFVRGFTDARLKVIQQPGSVQQLFDHFDKYYGYFFNTLLEITDVKDENAEHMMQHIGRATGLTQHCVMFWKKYAKIGFTMLPADLCADNRVNISLLKTVPLAARDRGVRRLLYDVMCIAKDEMLHAEKLAPLVPPKAWPIVMECVYANYYLGFLQRRDFNVSAMFADYNIENTGFLWYRLKKKWEWERTLSIEKLVAEQASLPIPVVGKVLSRSPSQYKMAVAMKDTPSQNKR